MLLFATPRAMPVSVNLAESLLSSSRNLYSSLIPKQPNRWLPYGAYASEQALKWPNRPSQTSPTSPIHLPPQQINPIPIKTNPLLSLNSFPLPLDSPPPLPLPLPNAFHSYYLKWWLRNRHKRLHKSHFHFLCIPRKIRFQVLTTSF